MGYWVMQGNEQRVITKIHGHEKCPFDKNVIIKKKKVVIFQIRVSLTPFTFCVLLINLDVK